MARKGISVVIPAAGAGRRMKSFGPKSSIGLGSDTLLGRQVTVIRSVYPQAEIIVVVGFEADQVLRSLPSGVKAVENERFDETNIVRSLGMGLRVASHPSVLLIYGDLVFNAQTISGMLTSDSYVVSDRKGMIDPESAGMILNKDLVAHFDFGLPVRWAQIAHLKGKELDRFKDFTFDRERGMCLGWEAMNHVIEGGGRIRTIEPEGMKIVEVARSRDIEKARRIG